MENVDVYATIYKLRETRKGMKKKIIAVILSIALSISMSGIEAFAVTDDYYMQDTEESQIEEVLDSVDILEVDSEPVLGDNSDAIKFAGGKGTKSNPYKIATAEQLNNIRYGLSSHYELINDIDLSSYGGVWVPIGTDDNPFTGSIDGSGYCISNLTIQNESCKIVSDNLSDSAWYPGIGLFGTASDKASFSNINMATCHISITSFNTTKERVSVGILLGGICKSNGISITNCTVKGSIYTNDTGISVAVGGIVGSSYNSTNMTDLIDKCENYATIILVGSSSRFGSDCGGISGGYIGTINNCSNYGDIECRREDVNVSVGGICSLGRNISNCNNNGKIEAFNVKSNASCLTGGICAYAVEVNNCANYGQINRDSTGKSGRRNGGICALLNGFYSPNNTYTIKNCVNYSKTIGNGTDESHRILGGIGTFSQDAAIQLINNSSVADTLISGKIATNVGEDTVEGKNIESGNESIVFQYNNHKYEIVDKSYCWDEAKVLCEKAGGHLVTITSEEEQAAIEEYLIKGTKNVYWIGGEKTNRWRWVTDEEWEYTNWAFNEPNNERGTENKAMMYRNQAPLSPDNGILGEWNDEENEGNDNMNYPINGFYSIAQNNVGYICEWGVDEPSKDSDITDDYYYQTILKLVTSKGNKNAWRYIGSGSNYPHVSFMLANDSSFAGMANLVISDIVFRKLDGWKDLVCADTSKESAVKILGSLLYEGNAGVEALSDAKTAKKWASIYVDVAKDSLAIDASTFGVSGKDLAELEAILDKETVTSLIAQGKFSDLSKELVDTGNFSDKSSVSKLLKSYETDEKFLGEIGKGLNLLGTGLKGLKITAETVDRIYEYNRLLEADEAYLDMLLYIQSNSAYSPVQDAAKEMYEAANGHIQSTSEYLTKNIATFLGEELADEAIDKAFEEASKKVPWLYILKKVCDIDIVVVNATLKPDKIVEKSDNIRIIAYLGNTISRWQTENTSNALTCQDIVQREEYSKRAVFGEYYLLQIRKEGERTLQSIMETLHVEDDQNYRLSKSVLDSLELYESILFNKKLVAKICNTTVSCPVNVEIYENGEKILTIFDGVEKKGYVSDLYYDTYKIPWTDEYVKSFFYPAGQYYTIKIIGNDKGLVDCYMRQINEDGKIEEKSLSNEKIDKDMIIQASTEEMLKSDNYIVFSEGETESKLFNEKKDEFVPVQSINMTENLSLKVGESDVLQVNVLPVSATNKTLKWSVDNSEIAEISSNGLIKAKSEGESFIYASPQYDDSIVAICKLVVSGYKGVEDNDIPEDRIIPNGIWIAGIKDMTYTGKSLKPSIRVYDGTTRLNYKTDYTIKYKNNKNIYSIVDPNNLTILDKKKAPQILITMKGNYSGKETVFFSIHESGYNNETENEETYSIGGDKIRITDNAGNPVLSAYYNKSGAKPSIRVMYESTVLKEGKDYTLKYSANTTYPAKKASVTITGIGNYTNKKTIPITITQRPFSEGAGITVVATDKVEGKKAGQYTTTVKVFDSEGKLLKAGTDYDKKISYFKAGTELTKTDYPKAGDVITVRITGKGGYSNSYIEANYNILASGEVNDIGKATFKIKNQTYNKGKAITITSQDMFEQAFIGKGKTPLKLSTDGGETGDFMVVPGSYVKNTAKGTAKVTLMGINGKTGTKTVSYNIGARSLKDIWFGWIRVK